MEQATSIIGKAISLQTLRNYLRKAGYRYKRMRLSLKEKRDEILYELFKEELTTLKQLEDKGEIDLYFFDEMGITLTAKVGYAWQPIGKTVCLPATRSKSLTTLGFVNRAMDLQSFIFKGAANSEVVIACMNEFASQIKKKTIVIMDNASAHKSKAFMQNLKRWKQQELYIQFIPAYCPELNLIERLWKHIKYQCLPIEAYTNLETLEKHLNEVVLNIKKYQFNFY